jgi:hypothetical protein
MVEDSTKEPMQRKRHATSPGEDQGAETRIRVSRRANHQPQDSADMVSRLAGAAGPQACSLADWLAGCGIPEWCLSPAAGGVRWSKSAACWTAPRSAGAACSSWSALQGRARPRCWRLRPAKPAAAVLTYCGHHPLKVSQDAWSGGQLLRDTGAPDDLVTAVVGDSGTAGFR